MRRGEIRWYTFKAPDKRRPFITTLTDQQMDQVKAALLFALEF